MDSNIPQKVYVPCGKELICGQGGGGVGRGCMGVSFHGLIHPEPPPDTLDTATLVGLGWMVLHHSDCKAHDVAAPPPQLVLLLAVVLLAMAQVPCGASSDCCSLGPLCAASVCALLSSRSPKPN